MWLPLKDLISTKVKQTGIAKQLKATSVVEWFNQNRDDVVGSELAPYVQAVFVRDRALTLACPSSAAMQEIRLREADIIARLRQKFGNNVNKLKFRVG